jgi:hypothetical protein
MSTEGFAKARRRIITSEPEEVTNQALTEVM